MRNNKRFKNQKDLRKLTVEEIAKMIKKGFSEKEIEKEKMLRINLIKLRHKCYKNAVINSITYYLKSLVWDNNINKYESWLIADNMQFCFESSISEKIRKNIEKEFGINRQDYAFYEKNGNMPF